MIKTITKKNEKVASQEAERKEAEIRNKEFYLIGTETVNMEDKRTDHQSEYLQHGNT